MKVYGKEENLTPATQKPLNRWSPKFVQMITSGISTTMRNFIQIGLAVSFLPMRDFAPLSTKWLGYFLGRGSWERLPPRRGSTDFDAKYVKRRGSAQRSAFEGSRNQCLRFRPQFPPPKKNVILGPCSEIFRAPLTDHVMSRMRRNSYGFSLRAVHYFGI